MGFAENTSTLKIDHLIRRVLLKSDEREGLKTYRDPRRALFEIGRLQSALGIRNQTG